MLTSSLDATKTGAILVMVPVLFEILFVAVVSLLLLSAKQDFDSIALVKNVLLKVQTAQFAVGSGMGLLGESNNALRVQQLDEIERQIGIFRKNRDELLTLTFPPELKELRQPTLDLYEKGIKFGERTRSLYSNSTLSGGQRATLMRPEGIALIIESQDLSSMLAGTTARIASQEPEEQRQFRWRLGILLSAGFSMSAIISLLSARFFTSGVVRNIKRVGNNTQLIAEGKNLPPVLKGDTEIAKLDRALHQASDLLHLERRKEFSILYNAADIICSLDEKLNFIAIGPAVEKLWGYTPTDLIGRSMITLLADSTTYSTIAAFQRLAASELTASEQQGEIENVIRCRNKSLKNVIWNVSWSSEESNFTCVVRDVTELRVIQQLKRGLISIASHDLRSPLMSICAGLDILLAGRRGDVPENDRKELASAEHNLSQLLWLINDLLDFERLESGKTSLTPGCVSAYDICMCAKESLQSIASLNGVKIVGPTGDAALLGDERQLSQAVSNLLSSAIKTSSSNDTVTLKINRHPDAMVEISVSDNRPLLASTDCQIYFDRFKRNAQGLSKEVSADATERATALSLAVVKAIATAHRGTVGIESQKSTGTTVWIKVPEMVEPC